MTAKQVGLERIHSKILPVTRVSISDAIVEQIMNLIEDGDLQPGQRLPSERELCVRFGTGRSSLREALRCLSIVGVLNARVGQGTSVAMDGGKLLGRILQWRMITEQHHIENLLAVRMALEGLAAEAMATQASEEDIATLDSFITRMGDALEDRKRFLALDLDFHLFLAKSSGNGLVYDLLSMLRAHLAKSIGRVLPKPDSLRTALLEHRRIVQKVRERDAKGARDAMTKHLTLSMMRYRKAQKEAAAVVLPRHAEAKQPS